MIRLVFATVRHLIVVLSEQHLRRLGREYVSYYNTDRCHATLLLGGARAGVNVRVVALEGWQPQPDIVDRARGVGKETGASIEVTADLAGVEGADIVYTDVWASMGQEAEAKKRKAAFATYQVDASLMKRAKPDATFMHCLPAHRGNAMSRPATAGTQEGSWSRLPLNF